MLNKQNLYHEALQRSQTTKTILRSVSDSNLGAHDSQGSIQFSHPTRKISSESMSQIALLESDGISADTKHLFPEGFTDINGQQLDLRKTNSWVMRLHEVSSVEMAEVFAINAISPAVLNSRLKILMEKNMEDMKFIVNVSAMEGDFIYFFQSLKIENIPDYREILSV